MEKRLVDPRAHWPAILSLICELLPNEGVHLKDKVEGS